MAMEQFASPENAESQTELQGERMEMAQGMGERIAGEVWERIPEEWRPKVKEYMSLALNWAPLVGDIKMANAVRTGTDTDGRKLTANDKLMYSLSVGCSAVSVALTGYFIYMKAHQNHFEPGMLTPTALAAGGSHAAAELFQGIHTIAHTAGGIKRFASETGANSAAWLLGQYEKLRGGHGLTLLDLSANA